MTWIIFWGKNAQTRHTRCPGPTRSSGRISILLSVFNVIDDDWWGRRHDSRLSMMMMHRPHDWPNQLRVLQRPVQRDPNEYVLLICSLDLFRGNTRCISCLCSWYVCSRSKIGIHFGGSTFPSIWCDYMVSFISIFFMHILRYSINNF